MSRISDIRPEVIERVAQSLEQFSNELCGKEGTEDLCEFLSRCQETLEDEVARDSGETDTEGVKVSILSRAARLAMSQLVPVAGPQ
jgi:hypothetical protein